MHFGGQTVEDVAGRAAAHDQDFFVVLEVFAVEGPAVVESQCAIYAEVVH